MSDDERKKQVAELTKTLKEGERLVGPTRRPDGTLRKGFRIRANYTPPDEVPKYQPKPALLKKEMGSAGPPGYDPDADARPKTKSVKRNERKKEKRLQAAVEKDKNVEGGVSEDSGKKESLEALTSLVNDLSVQDSTQQAQAQAQDVDKKIRALKKKIRLTEALEQRSSDQDLKPEQLEKLAKLEDWRRELKELEDEKSETTVS
ncbi:partner of Y14 and mago [Vigna unguiculata]|uniref:partner of Y14 and mago n=1 Tax=Vigna unguiculata TaxID=3917 RepID=UPI001016DE2C|nr:partner of Y14 and mago [Vigna unguiculata]